MNFSDLNELAATVHQANRQWWVDLSTGNRLDRNKGELLMLVITELSEALEGVHKNLMDDKLPTRKMEEVELADAYIRLLDYAGGFGYKLEWVDTRKLPENKGHSLPVISGWVVEILSQRRSESYAINFTLGLIREYCLKFGCDLEGAMVEKIEFNRTREDHKHESRKLANGKRF